MEHHNTPFKMNFFSFSTRENLSLVIQYIQLSDCLKLPFAFQFIIKNAFSPLFHTQGAHKEHKLHIVINGSLVQAGPTPLPNFLESSISLYQNNYLSHYTFKYSLKTTQEKLETSTCTVDFWHLFACTV